MAATGGAAVATTMFGDAFRQTSFGATPGGNVLVVLSLRGGIDGLGMVVPHGDPGYYTARPRDRACREAPLIAQDAMFGLHPQMAPLQWLWDGGRAGGRARGRAGGPEPVALPGDGADRGRRPGLQRCDAAGSTG